VAQRSSAAGCQPEDRGFESLQGRKNVRIQNTNLEDLLGLCNKAHDRAGV
jgi:hypothetical protein